MCYSPGLLRQCEVESDGISETNEREKEEIVPAHPSGEYGTCGAQLCAIPSPHPT